MPSDNVTPFRPRPSPPKPRRRLFNLQSQRGKALLVQALTAICFALTYVLDAPPWSYVGLAFGIAGVAIAMGNRQDGMPWARTHHEHAMRTIVIGAAAWTLLTVFLLIPFAPLIPIVYWGRIAIVAWTCIRALIGLGLALFRRPIPNPRGLFI